MVEALVHLSVSPATALETKTALTEIKGVEWVRMAAAPFDLHALVVAENLEELGILIDQEMMAIQTILKRTISVILDEPLALPHINLLAELENQHPITEA